MDAHLHTHRRALIRIAGCLAAMLLGLLPAAPASAGTYHVYGCRTPAGAPAPVSGWAPLTVSGQDINYVRTDTCASGGDVDLAALPGNPGTPTLSLAWVAWAFTAPPGTVVERTAAWRYGTLGIRPSNDLGPFEVPDWRLVATAPQDPSTAAITFADYEGGYGAAGTDAPFGNPAAPLDPVNRVGFDALAPVAGLPSRVHLALFCEATTCEHFAHLRIAATDVVLRDDTAPEATGLFGAVALPSAPVVSGQIGVSVSAKDVGSGLAQGYLVIDGVPRPPVSFTSPGSCTRSTASDGRPGYTQAVPCPLSGSVTVPFDTTSLPDGPHLAELWIEDASGNRALASSGAITVSNPGPPPPETPPVDRGPVNGSGATERATLSAWWEDGKRRPVALARPWDGARSATLRGTLVEPGGKPISGASLEVVSTSSAYGAGPVAIGKTTTAADGTYAFPVRLSGGSAAVAVRWRARLLDAQPAESTGLTLAVAAGSSIKANRKRLRRGDSVRFSGQLVGTNGVRLRVPVGLYAYSGGRWLAVRSTVTDAAGRWTISLRFRSSVGRIPFRVGVQQGVLYPYEPGNSRTIRLRVRS